MNKALLPLLLCCFIFPASGKDAGWQWYNEKISPKEKENKPVPAAPRQEPDIMQKLAALQTATKRALYEAILYPGVDNFVKYFRLQNYWTQQAGLFTMSAKKAMLAHPKLDYNLQYSHYNGTVRNQLAADQAQQRQAIAKLAEHYGIMFFYRIPRPDNYRGNDKRCNQKPDKKINKTVRREYDFHHFPRLFPIPYCPACFSWSAICSFTFCVRTPLSGIFWLFIRSS